MVDIGIKSSSRRIACAEATVFLPDELWKCFESTNANDWITKKGPVISTAIVAGTMGVKKTDELIPFCHPLLIESIKFDTQLDPKLKKLIVRCTVAIQGKTGVEMEALTGVSTFCLTFYDMCKSVSHGIVVENIRLVSKTGGKSGISPSTNTWAN